MLYIVVFWYYIYIYIYRIIYHNLYEICRHLYHISKSISWLTATHEVVADLLTCSRTSSTSHSTQAFCLCFFVDGKDASLGWKPYLEEQMRSQNVLGFCPRMRSKGSRFTLVVWGLRVCSLDVAQRFATVRNRPRKGRMAVPIVSSAKEVIFGALKRRVASFRVACRGTSWHSDVFRIVWKVIFLCGKSNTFATFSEDALQFFVAGNTLVDKSILSFSKVSKQVVLSFCLARVALCDIPINLFENVSKVIFYIFCGRRNTFESLSQDDLKFFVASAALWKPPSSFCVAGAALETCRVACFVRIAMSGLREVVTTCKFLGRHGPGMLWHAMTLRTPYSTLHTLLSTLYNLQSTLYTLHSTHSTPHSTLYTLFTLYTPHFTFYAPHFTLETLHSTLCTPHSTLYTPHIYTPRFTLYTPHSTLHTLHSTLQTLHSTLYTPLYSLHFTHHTLQSTLYTLHSTLYTLHSALYTLHFTLHTFHLTLHTPHLTLYTPHSTLHTPHSTLHFTLLHFTLYTLHSTLYTSHSTLYILRSTLDTWHFTLHTLHSTL